MTNDRILSRLMSLHPKSIDLVLDRLQRVLAALDHPERKLPPVVHVAGTNGKGSTVAFLRAILEAAGYVVHVYTSPHLIKFNERIRLAGHIISDDHLAEMLNICENANQGLPITFFEITTAAAFLAFSKTPADIVLLETGLGGKFDATNVIDQPRLTCITPVSMDHQHFLGSDVLTIMGEKAGILKQDVPCVVADQDAEALLQVVSEKAKTLNARLLVAGKDWPAELDPSWPKPNLVGHHQCRNAATAVACAKALCPDFIISDSAVKKGLVNVEWPGRLQHLSSGLLADKCGPNWQLWLDGGHNVAAARTLSDHLGGWADDHVWVIFGGLNQRDPAEFLTPLHNQIAGLWAVEIPDEENTLSVDQISQAARTLSINVKKSPSVQEALEDILLNQRGRILICGSLYLAGHVLGLNSQNIQSNIK